MSDVLANEVAALSARADSERERWKHRLARIKLLLGFQDNYRRVFCDPVSGELTAAGKSVLADLAKEANFGRFDPVASDAVLRTNEGARRMILHIFGRLDLGGDDLIKLSQDLREKTE